MANSHTTFVDLFDNSYFNNIAKKAKGMSQSILGFPCYSLIKITSVAWQNEKELPNIFLRRSFAAFCVHANVLMQKNDTEIFCPSKSLKKGEATVLCA